MNKTNNILEDNRERKKEEKEIVVNLISSIFNNDKRILYDTIGQNYNIHDVNRELKQVAVKPLVGEIRVISPFGPRKTPTKQSLHHNGLDIVSDSSNKNIYSITNGIVIEKDYHENGYGHYVIVKHLTFTSLYAHMEDETPHEVGDFVEVAEIIGKVGFSGRATGPHLHLETKTNNENFNPMIILEKIDDINDARDKFTIELDVEAHK